MSRRRTSRWLPVAALLAILSAGPVGAVLPDEILDDPALEARARTISQDLRCLVCQNQSIDDSNADLARDLRVLVRERLLAGDTDEEVVAYVVARYGDYVLLTPPFKPLTYLLWLGPVIVVGVGAGVAIGYLRRQRRRAGDEVAPLTPEEEERLARVLRDQP